MEGIVDGVLGFHWEESGLERYRGGSSQRAQNDGVERFCILEVWWSYIFKSHVNCLTSDMNLMYLFGPLCGCDVLGDSRMRL